MSLFSQQRTRILRPGEDPRGSGPASGPGTARTRQAGTPLGLAGRTAAKRAARARAEGMSVDELPPLELERRGVDPAQDATADFTQAGPAGSAATQLLHRYRPLETRAAGGFGTVEVCLDKRLQRRVAIKRIPLSASGLPSAPDATAIALGEARTLSLLQHPNIVSVIDCTYDAAYAYLVMEYVDGMSLAEFLAQVDGHSLTYDETAAIADALAQALAYAHENGVLHLDIKPANVLIDHSGHVKLTDFGMAALASAGGFGGARGGSIGYMPPEQLEGREVDQRSDIFALGTVLYQCLCAEDPFAAETPAASLAKIEAGATPPSELLPDLSPDAEDTLLAALSPNPDDRMLDVQEFLDYLAPQLGSAREGRRSLARVIARLTADDADDATASDAGTAKPGNGTTADGAAAGRSARPERRTPWGLAGGLAGGFTSGSGDSAAGPVQTDPAEGWLGSRTPRARQIALAALSGVPAAAVAWTLLGTLGVTDPASRGAVAAAVAATSAAAPQIGSALALTGIVLSILNGTPLLFALPVAIAAIALTAAWWLVWGRTLPAASTSLLMAIALGLAADDPTLAAPIAAAVAGYFLPVAPAAASLLVGCLLATLTAALVAQGGALPAGAALEAFAHASIIIETAGAVALAAGVSALLDHHWRRYREAGSSALLPLTLALPLVASVAIGCLANPMEIAAPSLERAAQGAAVGTLSSIIDCTCAYMLGYRKTLSEGDRS